MDQISEPQPDSGVLVDATALTDFCSQLMAAAGCSDEEARRIAEPLVDANLTGHDSHGVSRVPRYVQMLGQGLVFAGRTVTVESDGGAFLMLDGHTGFGQTVGHDAVAMGCDRAADTGVSVVALKNAGHLGRIGAYAIQAADKGLISIHMVNVRGRSLVAPFGGIDRRMATSPYCVGVPLTGEPPIVLDFATSMIAEGKAFVALKRGVPLPEGSMISATGQPSRDPADLYGDSVGKTVPDASRGPGALAVFGGHKGSGLNFMIEVLAGALTGSGVNRTLKDDNAPVFRNGMLSIFLDPERFSGREAFEEQVSDYAAYVKSARPAEGHEAVLLPGDVEIATRAKRQADGLPLDPATWRDLTDLAARLGIADVIPGVRRVS